MPHFPVNHPARPLYRVLAGLVGVYILVFGVVGRRRRPVGDPLFARDSTLGARAADQPRLRAHLGDLRGRS